MFRLLLTAGVAAFAFWAWQESSKPSEKPRAAIPQEIAIKIPNLKAVWAGLTESQQDAAINALLLECLKQRPQDECIALMGAVLDVLEGRAEL